MTPFHTFTECPRERITAAEFLALPTRETLGAFGPYRRWRELVIGKWWIFYRGASFGAPVRLRWRPIVTISAAGEEIEK